MTRLWNALGTGRARFARLRALLWVAIGIGSFPLGWADSVVLVWVASAYANAVGELGAAEAADDEAVLSEIRALRGAVTAAGGRTTGVSRPARTARPATVSRRARPTAPVWRAGPRPTPANSCAQCGR